MKIDILCSSADHPIRSWLESWMDRQSERHVVRIIEKVALAQGGDLLFLISCGEIVTAEVRSRYRTALVVHASNLPEGKGWSPHIWQILEGRKEITVTLFEAVDKLDAGPIWNIETIRIEKHELFDEINDKLFAAEVRLMDYAVTNIDRVQPRAQEGTTSVYYRKRTPEDSRIDPLLSIADQFNTLRVADPVRYPAFFDLNGCRYTVQIHKIK